ncbi:MAG: ABC transporter substrate-binding protein [Gammaproteobacteria bacterium]|jgi:phospholipid transport system substrate-binding protein|nr:ABC transporter substrate-binding protein [Gammaproteobacteria bacterium]
MLKRLLLLLVTGFTLGVSASSFAQNSPTDDIRASVDTIIAILNDGQLDRAGKRSKISEVVYKRFDFRAMSQRTLATNWRKTTDAEKDKFVDLFSKLIENSYIGKLDSYTNEKVDYTGEKLDGRKAVVETLIITTSADIPVDYRVYQKGGQWLIYDVIIEGVSLISNYRSSYQEIMKNEGFEGLLTKMQAKIDELASTSS